MEASTICAIVRSFLFDRDDVVFSDRELFRFIDSAVRKYCEDTGLFRGCFQIHPNEEGLYVYPEDYIYFLTGWNCESVKIEPSTVYSGRSVEEINITVKGNPVMIYDCLNDSGTYRLYPDPHDEQILIFREGWDEQYGTFIVGGHGVYENVFGACGEEEYGTDKYIYDCKDVGEVYYIRYAKVTEIFDYLALVYWTLYLAFNADSDFCDMEQALIYKNEYIRRISATQHMTHSYTGLTQDGKFY